MGENDITLVETMEVNDNMPYLLIEFIEGDEEKWRCVLAYIIPIATHVEFNILYSDSNLKKFLDDYQSSIVEIISKKKKIYPSGKILRMTMTDQVIGLLKRKSFSDYNSWFLEDPSFYIDDRELIATITHEDQIYLDPKHVDLSRFRGFKLEHRILEKEGVSLWRRLLQLFASR